MFPSKLRLLVICSPKLSFFFWGEPKLSRIQMGRSYRPKPKLSSPQQTLVAHEEFLRQWSPTTKPSCSRPLHRTPQANREPHAVFARFSGTRSSGSVARFSGAKPKHDSSSHQSSLFQLFQRKIGLYNAVCSRRNRRWAPWNLCTIGYEKASCGLCVCSLGRVLSFF